MEMMKNAIYTYIKFINITVYIYLLCGLIDVNIALTLPDSIPLAYSGETNIEISNVIHPLRHRQKRSSPTLPETFNLTLSIHDSPITLSLTRNTYLTRERVPVYLANHQSIEFHQHKEQINEAFYQDPKYTASVHIECKTLEGELCKHYDIFASFITNGEHFILHKNPHDESREQSPKKYRIAKPTADYNFKTDYAIRDTLKVKDIAESKHRSKRQVTGNYEVELLIVTDYSVYKYWYDSSSSSFHSQKHADAQRNINIYIAFLINGVDVRYQNLPGATYKIKIVYAGLLITTTQFDSRWTEDRKSASNPPTVPADGVLDAFSAWINLQKAVLPAHDHAMLITRYDLAKDSATGTTGYATLSAMCTTSSQSLVEERFNFISHTVAAHEIGHSLGAIHDGDQNRCDGSARYIMASSSSAQTGAIAHHPWEFSACTTNEFKTYIQSLFSNCMLIKNSALDANALSSYLTPYIGQSYTIDQQCEKLGGTGSHFCVGHYDGNYESICTGIWCSSPVDSNLCTLYIPGEGTTCGNKKWCINGACTASTSAPAGDDTCLFGDDRGIVVNTQTCAEVMRDSPSFCYNSGVRTKCCQSCKQNYDPSYPDCLYGDKGDCSTLTEATQCYVQSNAQLCCRTCAKFETGIPGCTYGDQARGCSKTNCPVYTPTQRELCCATCYDGTTTQRTTPTTTTPTTTTHPTTTTQAPPPTTTSKPVVTSKIPTTTMVPSVVSPRVTTPGVVSTTTTLQQQSSTISPTFPKTITSTVQSTTVKSDERSWLVPLIGAVAGILFIVVIIVICICMCRNVKKKASRRASSIRSARGSSRGFTNPSAPYIIAEENDYVVSKPPPAPQQGFSYTTLAHVNGEPNRPLVPKGTHPTVALKPPTNLKRPVGPQRSVSIERGTVVRSAPPPPRPINPPNLKPVVPKKPFLYHDERQGDGTVNHGYRHGH